MIYKIYKRDKKILHKVESKSFIHAVVSVKSNLQNAGLSHKDLGYANFGYADCKEADFTRSDIRKASFKGADLRGANFSQSGLRDANFRGAWLSRANLSEANLRDADFTAADLSGANFKGADFSEANLSGAYLQYADLSAANLSGANLSGADLSAANLSGANLFNANLRDAKLNSATLKKVKNMVKMVGVEPGNYYWKRFHSGLCNNRYQFYVGLNVLRKGEVFANDESITCSYPGFYFASRSWCAIHYPHRPLEARIRIPENAKINEPWATSGEASADKIEILQVLDVKTGKDVTDKYRISEID